MARARDESYHALLTGLEGYQDQVAGYAFYPPRLGSVEESYAGRYAASLARLGLTPYEHQARALESIEARRNVVVATPTASGKSLVYQLPTLEAAATGSASLFLYPTKALAHDQLGRLLAMADRLDLDLGDDGIACYDGDTPAARRARVREGVQCVLTNPDMLHYGVLPYHARWAPLLGRLDTIVIDELHSYRGVLGTHVANVLRRLLRVARHYGASPRLVAASATIGNPLEHAEALAGEPFELIDDDQAPRGPREFILWRPAQVGGAEGAGAQAVRRRSATTEAAQLAAAFVRGSVKSIFFCNSRKVAELLRRYASGYLTGEEAPLVQSYRAGYSPVDRRLIEQGFRNGDIRVLTATSALELGMDIGGVDAVVLVGYPGSKMALWQRSGRAGREGRRALTLLVPGNDPLDEYYLHHPDLLTEGRVEDAVADPYNTELHPLHIACAAAELPIRDDEVGLVDPELELANVQGLHRVDGGWVHIGRYPHRRVRIRGGGDRMIRLKDASGRSLGTADLATALRDLHPGAVHLHQGEAYLVVRLDLDRGLAELLPHIEDTYTQPRSETDIEVLSVDPTAVDEGAPMGIQVGRVRVRTSITSYVRKRYISGQVLDERALDLPELSYPTQALWFSAREVEHSVRPDELPGALHALEHTLIGLLPAFVLCERADVGGVSYPLYPPTGESRVFIYDGYPGGVGYARAGAAQFEAWLTAARDLLRDCPCESGCPRCVLSPKCGNGNQFLDKGAARRLADALLGRMGSREDARVRA